MTRTAAVKEPDTLSYLNEGLTALEAEIAKLAGKRLDALTLFMKNPAKAQADIRLVDGQISELKGQMVAVEEAIAMEQAKSIEREASRRKSLAAENTAAVIRLAKERVELAAAIDQAKGIMIDAIRRYVQNGNACSAYARRALTDLHGADVTRMHDSLAINLNLSDGRGSDAAVALANGIREIIAAFDSPYVEANVQINHFCPKSPATFADASRTDAATLAARFGTKR